MNASAPSRGLGPFAALAISLAWLVVLAPLAYRLPEERATNRGDQGFL
jgi:hypothetical protein